MYIQDSILDNHFLIGLFFLVISSFVAGYVDSIAGGAGLILIPTFISLGIPPQVALGQEKLVSTIGTIGAIRNFIKNKSIIWKAVPIGILSALIGSYIGAKIILVLDPDIINKLILIFIPIALMFTLLRSKIVVTKSIDRIKNSNNFLLLSIVCFFVGFYDGFFGPGTGSLFIIALVLINKFTLLNATATSKIFNFSSNIGAFVAFVISGKILFLIGIPMIIANYIGNHIGSKQAIKTNGNVVKTILIITVLLLFITLIFKTI